MIKLSPITSYAVIISGGGGIYSVASVGRCSLIASATLFPHPVGEIVIISDDLFNEIARGRPHYWRYDGTSITRKKPLILTASKFAFAANFPSVAPAAGAPVTWDFVAISWSAPEPVMMRCNGPVGAHQNALNVVSSRPANIKVEVDPEDPNYYTDRDATPASALGPGSGAGAIVLNAEAPND